MCNSFQSLTVWHVHFCDCVAVRNVLLLIQILTVQASGSLEGVELGQFIGRTQMGRVFRGTFNGEPVTVKVCHTHAVLLPCAVKPVHLALWEPFAEQSVHQWPS